MKREEVNMGHILGLSLIVASFHFSTADLIKVLFKSFMATPVLE